MERLKAILVDKILDLSIGSGDEVKAKLDRIQRFRDFANACQTLMKKYPAIEDELIKMVESGDFDTKVASSRVDTIIRLADAETATINRMMPKEDDVAINLPDDTENIFDADDFLMERVNTEDEQVYTPEDIDYEELGISAEEVSESGYVSYEDVRSEDASEIQAESGVSLDAEESNLDIDTKDELEPDTIVEDILSSEQSENMPPITFMEESNNYEEEELAANRKLHIRRTIQIVGIVIAVVALIFIIKFVMIHWQTILIVAGILAVLAILFVWFKRKRG
ncbi:hypothetical protein JGH11_17995 [Dysgonomonas sp. Marseille-P4677]|uniref:hypothetical protein n=1 Tax=Dysgonomonas sp. Marseille-P4677 TaxID=2364790 RepID=UPI0019129F9C|nr:hypothetical protein [Dysgonomonas sp. Marseille-P4677]MBK5722766.1 hypothetical protein [Dysgonomonas sp. Marseille-P4677]